MRAELTQNRSCVNGCLLDNSSNAHAHELLTKTILRNFISLRAFTVYLDSRNILSSFSNNGSKRMNSSAR